MRARTRSQNVPSYLHRQFEEQNAARFAATLPAWFDLLTENRK